MKITPSSRSAVLIAALASPAAAQFVQHDSIVDSVDTGLGAVASGRATGDFDPNTDLLSVTLTVVSAFTLPAPVTSVKVIENQLTGGTSDVLDLSPAGTDTWFGADTLSASEAASLYRGDLEYEVYTGGSTSSPDLRGVVRLSTASSARPTPTLGGALPPGTFTTGEFVFDYGGASGTTTLAYAADAIGFGSPPTNAFLRSAGGGPPVLLLGSVGPGSFAGTVTSPSDALIEGVLSGALELVMSPGPGGGNLVGPVEEGILNGNNDRISTTVGGVQHLRIHAGAGNGGMLYLVLGSVSGTSPGLPLNPFLTLPLNPDPYFSYTLSSPGAPPLANGIGVLDESARGEARFEIPQGASLPATLTFHHAAVILNPVSGSIRRISNPIAVDILQ